MNRRQLVEELGSLLGSIEQADEALSAIVDTVIEQVAAGGKVSLPGFGVFEPVARRARQGRNPRSGEPVGLQRTRVPKFRAGSRFRSVVGDPEFLGEMDRAPAPSKFPDGPSRPLKANGPSDSPTAIRQRPPSTFIVTWNPYKWRWDETEREAAVTATAGGGVWKGQWATGNRKGGILDGDRVFMLKQGPEPRGLVASGRFRGEVFQDDHWDDSHPGLANYAPIEWDAVLPESDALPLSLLKAEVSPFNWEPPGGGVLVPEPLSSRLETLWTEHVYPPASAAPARPKPRLGSQGWQTDPIRRRLVENHAQTLLEQSYRADGWEVSDTRYGNPFDAVAVRGGEIRYLEAKGTETDGVSINVTPGEVAFARAHLGECVLGVVAGIEFADNGELNVASGEFTIHEWNPDAGLLTPTSYRWSPPAGQLVHQ